MLFRSNATWLVAAAMAFNLTRAAATLTGDLVVTTGSVAGLSIATGNGPNTINAEALTNDQVLTLTGNDAADFPAKKVTSLTPFYANLTFSNITATAQPGRRAGLISLGGVALGGNAILGGAAAFGEWISKYGQLAPEPRRAA